jgi:selenocysteine lyase/cysteine desulfurase
MRSCDHETNALIHAVAGTIPRRTPHVWRFRKPHSSNPTSMATTALVERARQVVLAWFNAAPSDYCVVFTNNCTGALKLVGESFPFEPGGRLLLTTDNHNSVNGVRELAAATGARIDYSPIRMPDLRLDRNTLSGVKHVNSSRHRQIIPSWWCAS